MSYESEANHLYYVMRFVDGLKQDIREMVMIQRPATLDAACAMALVQEEVTDTGRRREFRHYDSPVTRSTPKPTFPLPLAPVPDKVNPLPPDEMRATYYVKPQSADDKFRALKQYRRARGLCDRCDKKWVPGHMCSTTVHLHAVQELWELMSDDDQGMENSLTSKSDAGQLCVYVCLKLQ
jgi:5-methylcytosine-specific restriction endonuclease McrA